MHTNGANNWKVDLVASGQESEVQKIRKKWTKTSQQTALLLKCCWYKPQTYMCLKQLTFFSKNKSTRDTAGVNAGQEKELCY